MDGNKPRWAAGSIEEVILNLVNHGQPLKCFSSVPIVYPIVLDQPGPFRLLWLWISGAQFQKPPF